jgi:hypothetical protein
MAQQAHNDYCADEGALALVYADMVNAESLDLEAFQIDPVVVHLLQSKCAL